MAVVICDAAVGLLDEDAVACAVPDAAPGLVCPGQAERESRLPSQKYLRIWPLEEPAPGEPVMPVAERFDAVFGSEFRLRLARLGQTKVVEPEVRRYVGLHVAGKSRRALATFVHSVNPLPHHSSFSFVG